MQRCLPILITKWSLCKIIFVFICIGCGGSDETIDNAYLNIDFSTPVQVKSMNGFLHGINHDHPADSLLTLLAPRLLRSGTGFFKSYQRKKELLHEAKQILVLSDLWYNGPGDRFRVMPFEDYGVYEDFLIDVAQQTKGEVIYDVWNEPDVTTLWKGTPEQFFEYFKFTCQVLRRELGEKAIISAPSTHWIPKWVEGFANYCEREQVAPDIFSYHELYETTDPTSVQEHLRSLRYDLINRNRFLRENIKEIQVNEYGYNGSQHNPAMILGYLHNLEEGEADGACRACWREEGISSCWNGTIGGLLTYDSLKPRASWWTHRLYAESVANRVLSRKNVSYISSFAYLHQSIGKVIVANSNTEYSVNHLSIKMEGLARIPSVPNDSILVKVSQLPDTHYDYSYGLEIVSENYYNIYNDHIVITIDNVRPLANYVLEINPVK